MGSLRRKLTYANVMATLAMFVALGGASYAAASLAPHSVGTAQLKNAAVTNAKLANGAVTGAKVAKGSLTGRQIKSSTLGTVRNASHASSADSATTADHASSADSANTAGSAITAGQATVLSSVSYRTAGPDFIGKCTTDPCKEEDAFIRTDDAVCPAGHVAIGGGAYGPNGVVIRDSKPVTLAGSTVPNAWEAGAANYNAAFDGSLTVYVVCIAASAVDNPSGV